MRIVTDIGKYVTVAAKQIILNERSIKKLVESRQFRVDLTTLDRIELLVINAAVVVIGQNFLFHVLKRKSSCYEIK